MSEGGDNATYYVNYDVLGNVVLKWQISTDNEATWTDLTESSTYVGVATNTLKVMDIETSMDGHKFRLVVTTPAFACHDATYFIADLVVDEDVDDDGDTNDKNEDNIEDQGEEEDGDDGDDIEEDDEVDDEMELAESVADAAERVNSMRSKIDGVDDLLARLKLSHD